MRIGYYQFRPQFGKIKKNRNRIIRKLNNIDADLIVLPELAFTGYHFRNKAELQSMAEDLSNSETLYYLKKLCSDRDMYIVCGIAEKSGREIYNSAVLIGPESLVHTYRKIHLFMHEKEMFTPGNKSLEIQEIKGAKIGIMVCFDWIFPETARILALKGAEIICHPSNLVLDYCQYAMITRCIENHVFAITTNRFGTENRPHGTMRFTGKSQIVAPGGKLLKRAASQREELFICTINPAEARNKRITELNEIFEDRRKEYYSEICQ